MSLRYVNWGSFGKQHGWEMRGKDFSLHQGMELNLLPIEEVVFCVCVFLDDGDDEGQ